MAATSLGNHADIPARSLNALREADLVVFEEDRSARGFLKAAGVHRPYLLFNEHHQVDTLETISATLSEGKTVAYMSDQGTPTIADPGASPVKIAYSLGANVRVTPGPSSITAALSACPFDLRQFYFAGFLPREEELRQQALKTIGSNKVASIVMDTPYRLKQLLTSCSEVIPNRRILLALDISGPNEDFVLGNARKLQEYIASSQPKSTGEEKLKLNFVLIVEGLDLGQKR